MLITYQTGKETDHHVSVILPTITINRMNYIINESVWLDAGAHRKTVMYF